jgi:Uma2 family endonuclease
MKVRAASAFYYPDAVLTCLPVVPDALFVTGARLTIEVLFESTQGRDRLEKLIAYRSLESLSQYVLVAQEETAADVYRRAFDG